MPKSIRMITKQQFSESTTIDGNRLDEAMQDVRDRFNAIPKGDLARRWFQTQYVLGHSPASANNSSESLFPSIYPFVSIVNEDSIGPLGELGPDKTNDTSDYEVSNQYRIKGIQQQNPLLPDSYMDEIAYTSSHIFSRPAILDGFNLVSLNDGGRFNVPFAGFELLNIRYPVYVVISIDNAYAPENRAYNQKLIFKYDVDYLRQDKLYATPLDVTLADEYKYKTPTDATGTRGYIGSIIDMNDLDIHVPAGGRIRVSIVGKFQDASYVFVVTRHTFTATITMLEEVESL